jgi:hypothetical protein
MSDSDPYDGWSLSDRLQMLAFEAELAELAHLPRSLITAVWNVFDRFPSMMWEPTDAIDREVRAWMKAKGWEVTRTNYDSDRKVYAWGHDVRGGPSPTLRISRQVLESYLAFVLLYHLDDLKVAPAARTHHPDDSCMPTWSAIRLQLDSTLR